MPMTSAYMPPFPDSASDVDAQKKRDFVCRCDERILSAPDVEDDDIFAADEDRVREIVDTLPAEVLHRMLSEFEEGAASYILVAVVQAERRATAAKDFVVPDLEVESESSFLDAGTVQLWSALLSDNNLCLCERMHAFVTHLVRPEFAALVPGIVDKLLLMPEKELGVVVASNKSATLLSGRVMREMKALKAEWCMDLSADCDQLIRSCSQDNNGDNFNAVDATRVREIVDTLPAEVLHRMLSEYADAAVYILVAVVQAERRAALDCISFG